MSNLYLGADNNMWTWGGNGHIPGSQNVMGHGLGSFLQNPVLRDAYEKRGFIRKLGPMGGQPAAPAPAPVHMTESPQGSPAFQNKLNRLTMNASDALYGGLLGYNPKPIMSPTGNTYNPPNPGQNYNFRNFNFGLLSGMGGK